MTTTLASTGPATRGRTRAHTTGDNIWFALMVGGWATFFALLTLSEPTVGDLWQAVRELPLVVEGLVWLLFFPFILALGVWESSWETWLRVLLVGCFAVGWSVVFWPRRRKLT